MGPQSQTASAKVVASLSHPTVALVFFLAQAAQPLTALGGQRRRSAPLQSAGSSFDVVAQLKD